MSKKKKFKSGDLVTESLSGRKAMVLCKSEIHKKEYTIRLFVQERSDWYTMDVPRSSLKKFKGVENKLIGFRKN